MKPTKDQWDKIAEDLNRLFNTVYLRCDGYLVTALLTRTQKTRLQIIVSVNGWEFRGDWFPTSDREMSEEARRFWFPRRKAKYTQKQIRQLEKIWGKRKCRAEGFYDQFVMPMPIWNSANSFIRHLKANNESIEVIDYETWKAEVDVIREAEA